MKFHRILTRAPWFRALLGNAWFWGLVITGVFETWFQRLPPEGETSRFLNRYCRADPVEYVETVMFFVGLAIVAVKGIAVFRERRAFDAVPLLGPHDAPANHEAAVENLGHQFRELRQRLHDTYWGRRLKHLTEFLRGTKSSEGLTGQLDYLANSDMDRLHGSHATLQVVIWSIPILGFLGTVKGITVAIANLTIEKIDTSMLDITGGLAVAFDTTAIALAFSLVLGFTSLFVKLREERLLAEMDEHCRLEAHRCFDLAAQQGVDLQQAQQDAAHQLLDRTHDLLDRHTSVWSDAVGAMRTDWQETLEQQRGELVETVRDGSRRTLEEHNDLLADSRQMWLDLHENMNRRLLADIDGFLTRRETTEQSLVASLEEFAGRIDRSTQDQAQRQTEETTRLLDGLRLQMGDWQTQLAGFTQALSAQGTALVHAGEQFEQLALRKAELAELQAQLTHNLEAIRGAEAFEETLHNLTAAVHLLTARARARDVA